VLTSETKRRIDACRDVLVGKLPLPTDQVELITLTSDGRGGVIVPNGIVATTQNAYVKLRRFLVEDSLVAVVSLPAGVFKQRIVAELDAEAMQMEAVRSLLPRFEAKIQRVLDRVWGNGTAAEPA